jgi:hypothetical protein
MPYYIAERLLLRYKMVICQDIVHNLVGTRYEHLNQWGDYLTYFNLFLLGFSLLHIPVPILQRSLLIFVCLYLLRWGLLVTTKCDMDIAQSKPRPLLSPNHDWFVLSGHLLTNAIITYSIWRGKSSSFVKNLSLLSTSLVMISMVMSREHYTIDMILTLVLLFLVLQLYGK